MFSKSGRNQACLHTLQKPICWSSFWRLYGSFYREHLNSVENRLIQLKNTNVWTLVSSILHKHMTKILVCHCGNVEHSCIKVFIINSKPLLQMFFKELTFLLLALGLFSWFPFLRIYKSLCKGFRAWAWAWSLLIGKQLVSGGVIITQSLWSPWIFWLVNTASQLAFPWLPYPGFLQLHTYSSELCSSRPHGRAVNESNRAEK